MQSNPNLVLIYTPEVSIWGQIVILLSRVGAGALG